MSAIGTLSKAAERGASHAHQRGRLNDMESLDGELEQLEARVSQLCRDGASPGSDAALHLAQSGGKRARATVLLMSASLFGSRPASCRDAATAVELLHSATLLHDDVIDEGVQRRGELAARVRWSNSVSVLAGDLLLTHALMLVNDIDVKLTRGVTEAVRALVDGELIQLRARLCWEPSQPRYWSVIEKKTASLFAYAAQLGGQLAGATVEEADHLRRFGHHAGVAYQLVDDVIDYRGRGTGKQLFQDLQDGKLTLPLLLAMDQDPDLEPSARALHGGDERFVDEVRERVLRTDACDRVTKIAAEHTDLSLEALSHLPNGPVLQHLMAVVQRLCGRDA